MLHIVKVDDFRFLLQSAVFLQISAGAGRQRIDAARACLHVALQRVRIEEDSGQPVFAVLDLLAAAQEERIVLVRAVGQRVAAARHECAAIAGIILRSEHIPGLRAKPALLLGLFDGFFFVGKFLMKQCAQCLHRVDDLPLLQLQESEEGIAHLLGQRAMIRQRAALQPSVRVRLAGCQRGQAADGATQRGIVAGTGGKAGAQGVERLSLMQAQGVCHGLLLETLSLRIVCDRGDLSGRAADDVIIRLQDGETERVDGGDLRALHQRELTV